MILRLALLWFDFLPLQRWLNAIGAALLLLGALPLLTGSTPGIAPLGVMLGTVFIALTPLVAGGTTLRFTSTRLLRHLRPHGRLRLLLGATLAVTLLALLFLVAQLLLREMLPPLRSADAFDPLRAAPLNVFLACWSVCALWWMLSFIASGWRLIGVAFWLAALSIWLLGKMLTLSVGDFLAGLNPGPLPAFVLALACWTAFAAWYVRATSIRSTIWQPDDEQSTSKPAAARAAPEAGEGMDPGALRSQAEATFLLGSPRSTLNQLIAGLAIAAAFLLVTLLVLRNHRTPLELIYVALPVLAMSCTAVGFGVVGRARYLWLRTGSDRTGLFARSERLGLSAALPRLAGGCAIIGIALVAMQRESVADMVLAAVTLAAFSVSAFYAGMAMTRGWTAEYWLVNLGLVALLAVLAFLLRPGRDLPVGVVLGAWGFLALLALLARTWAQHRWRDLDWRVSGPPRFNA